MKDFCLNLFFGVLNTLWPETAGCAPELEQSSLAQFIAQTCLMLFACTVCKIAK